MTVQVAIPCWLMRGGTSKGLYFFGSDLPADRAQRDRVLLAAMGSPDPRQIDGMGGSHPLTSKVAIISPSAREGADVDYLFLQVAVDRAEVSDSQNCGNILAGVGPFAIEKGMVKASDGETDVRIHMVNSGGIAVARVQTPNAVVDYEGSVCIDGVPGTAAPVPLEFLDIAGSNCGALLPTGQVVDEVDGVAVTCIDNGMPVVVLNAADFGKTGYESPADLETDAELKARVESIRLQMGERMNLGDVRNKTVPKMSLVAPPRSGGAICTRTFIPHRVHEAIGVLGAVSVATACALPGSVAQQVSGIDIGSGAQRLEVEHPSGFFSVDIELAGDIRMPRVERAALLRTARLLMRGEVLVPASVWSDE
ncbi:4-oxalomesaconate tautomerase [Microbulbifer hainanensis]|uniref:4-oxalomesaconate tautomerase n=1 Tax=Microbulbifer hainanensis TaxID=2735675 RepID=UPI0029C04812|nr:4-oxalomesaconate tautomerase [Microbulbifer hainanensis]